MGVVHVLGPHRKNPRDLGKLLGRHCPRPHGLGELAPSFNLLASHSCNQLPVAAQNLGSLSLEGGAGQCSACCSNNFFRRPLGLMISVIDNVTIWIF